MTILLFSDNDTELEMRIKNSISEKIDGHEFEIFQTDETLFQRFRQPRADLLVQVLAALEKGTLEKLISNRELLFELPVILILPEGDKEKSLLGHKLYPRLISYSLGDFSDVAQVVEKMVHCSCKSQI